MDRDTVKLLIHACQEATRVVKLLPQLPDLDDFREAFSGR